jgi:hypothetical protein
MKRLMLLGLLVIATALAGCASGPEFKSAQGTLPALAQNKARIFLYRSTSFGAAIQPDIKLNGKVVGSAQPNGIFYVDQEPGDIEIVIGTELEKRLTFNVAAGDVRYVKCDVNMGLFAARIIPKLMDANEAKSEIDGLAFTGGT